ncbi:MAG: hypothetical protein KDA85_04310 [Planctomycetaceae bacterium]|nr:hypothetical protein [Planctomycetaceae bacterium]
MYKQIAILLMVIAEVGCTAPQNAEFGDTAHAPWVVRTFPDRPDLWDSLKNRIAAPVGPFRFRANVQFVDDPRYYGLAGIDLIHALPADYPGSFVFIADGESSADDEDTLTLIYFYPNSTNLADYERPPSAVPEDELQTVRHLPHLVQELENNLSLANIDMADVLNCVPPDGIYRGVGQ